MKYLYLLGAMLSFVFASYDSVAAPVAGFYSADSITCDNSVVFVNTTTPASGTTYVWNFGDNTSSTDVNPVHFYTGTGTYTVSLIACNSTGCDTLTKANYIVYNPNAAACQYIPVPATGTTVIQTCSGVIADNGGILGYYANSSNGALSVSSNGGSRYRLEFTSFDLDQWNYDYMVIYDGPGPGYPVLGAYDIYDPPVIGDNLYTTSAQFYVQFVSDYYTNAPGFTLEFECLPDPPVADFYSPDTILCTGAANFINSSTQLTTGSNYLWNFGDNSTSTAANPTHLYSAQGSYTVSLIACSSFGCDTVTKTSYIVYDTTQAPCLNTVVPAWGVTNVQRCTGTITDIGGPANGYPDYLNGAVSVSNTSGAGYRFRFTGIFETESCCDYVAIYDGPDDSYPLIGQYQGWGLPNGGNYFYTSGNQFYVRFYADYSYTGAGFVMEYECLPVPPAPNFYSADTLSCDNTIAFTNTTGASGSGVTYLWSFGDNTTSIDASPVHVYADTGTYTVSLIACNVFGCDTLTRTGYIHYDTTMFYCDYTLLPPSGTSSIQQCSGMIMDNGGAGNYTNYISGGTSVSTTAGAFYRLKFNSFNLDWSNDYVTIYDGPDASYPVIGEFSAWNTPVLGSYIYTSSNQFYVAMYADYYGVAQGFQLEYECVAVPPLADFYSADTFSCDNSIAFVNTSTLPAGSTYTWNFGDGNTSSAAAPVHVYAATGTYTVSLVACNAFGCDTLVRTAYIHYDNTNPACQYTPVPPYNSEAITSCNGNIVDDGGAFGNHSNDVYGNLHVSSPSAEFYKLKFTSFDFTPNIYYAVTIFDGEPYVSPVIAQFDYYNQPVLNTYLYSSGNEFSVEVYTYGSVTGPGFVLNYECVPLTPIAGFTASDSSCNAAVSFTNTSTSQPTSYNWDFGDGNASTQANPVHTYTLDGNYNVTMSACNGFGCDTISQTVSLSNIVAASATVPDTVEAGEEFTLTSNSVNVIYHAWYIDNVLSGINGVQTAQIFTGGLHKVKYKTWGNYCSDSLITDIWVNGSLSIGNINGLNELHIFPNPATDYLSVRADYGSAEPVYYSLTNSLGQTLIPRRALEVYSGHIDARIDLQEFASGIYYLNLSFKDGLVTRRILVNKP